MFSSKKEVDRHVRTCFSKLKGENETNLRGYTVAKLYFKIGEYTSAQQYVSSYLSVKEDSAPAYKLLGQCYEKLNHPEKAIQSYQRSLQIESKQSDLIIDACKILLSDNLNLNPNKVKYWCDLAESEHIQHDAVFNLKLKLLTNDKTESKQIDDLILKEMIARPTVPAIRIRLIKHFIEQNKILDAFKYGFDIEMKNNDTFSNSFEWYNTLALVLYQYKLQSDTTHPLNWEYWLLSLITHERQTYFSLVTDSELNCPTNNNLNDANNLLFEFDQALEAAFHAMPKLSREKEFCGLLLKHYSAQFFLHAASFLFKREKVFNKNQWRETTKNCLPLLLISFHAGIPDPQELWLKHCDKVTLQLVQLLNKQGAFRCSQAGRTLLSCIDDVKENLILTTIRTLNADKGLWYSEEEILTQIRQTCYDTSWRKSLFRNLFTMSDQTSKISTSHLVSNKSINDITYELPTQADLETYEEIAQWLNPSSLQHLVYLGLGIKDLTDLRCSLFNSLNFSTQNLTNCSAGTLNQLDMESFLYSTILQAKRSLELEKYHYESYNSKVFDKPLILPFNIIARNLSTEEQSNWWSSAYKITRNITEDFAEARMTLQYGIEAIRGIGAPKIDLFIVLKLGQIFTQRLKKCTKQDHRQHLESRAETLYKSALHMLKLQSKGCLEQFRKYFKYGNNQNDSEPNINSMAEEAISFMAAKYFKRSDFEECINEFSGLQLPFASYFQAEAYRKLDESNKTPKKSKKLYMEKARECLNKTLDLLDGTGTDRNHPLKSIIHSEIKRFQFTNQLASQNVSNGFNQRDMDDDEDYNNDSYRRHDRSFTGHKTVEMENLLRQMMDSLKILRDEVSEILKPEVMTIKNDIVGIQTKLNTIEEIINKKVTIPDEETQELANLFDEELRNQVLAESNQMNLDYSVSRQLLQQPIVQNQHANMFPYNQLASGDNNITGPSNPYNNQIPFNGGYQMYMYPYQYPNVNIPPTQPTTQRSRLNWKFPDQLGVSQMSPQMPDHTNNVIMSHTSTPLQNLLMQKQPNMYDNSQQGNKLSSSSVADMLAAPPLLKSMYPYNNFPIDKTPPINVVITNSDPLPTHNTITQQPPLSVTIPIHHIKNNNITNVINDVVNEHYSMPNIEQITPTQQIKNDYKQGHEDNYDLPCPEPNITLPEFGIKSNDEKCLYAAQTKLFKHINKEWKERGSGEIKIIKNNIDGKVSVVMRRDELQAICLNHFITPELKISQSKPNPKVCTWVAPEITDGVMTMDKFCARFANVETANQFLETFEKAKKNLETTTIPATVDNIVSKQPDTIALQQNSKIFEAPKPPMSFFSPSQQPSQQLGETKVTPSSGGFTFLGNPIFSAPTNTNILEKSKETEIINKAEEPPKVNPFSSFSFSKAPIGNSEQLFSNIFSSNINKPSIIEENKIEPIRETLSNQPGEIGEGDDYVPTAQFQPVIPLPDLIEVKTGEEDEEIVFEHRAKLLRFDSTTKEWKERGIGNMKILINKNDSNKLRLLMRREQIFKLCCNQVITKHTQFKKKSETALTWCGQDFSENELKDEVLAIRFKTSDTCKQFHNIILEAQKDMSDEEIIVDDVQPIQPVLEMTETKTSFGDQFKPQVGSWSCEGCYISNKGEHLSCIACNAPKNGIPKSNNAPPMEVKESKSSFGDKFKPQVGSWTCEGCYISNKGEHLSCIACNSPKVGTQKINEQPILPTTINQTKEIGFGDKFKPKEGAWSCDSCYISNLGTTLYCVACDSPKDDTVPKKEPKNLLTPQKKFTFGIQPNGGGFSFGTPASTTTTDSVIVNSTNTSNTETQQKFQFGTPNSFSGFSFGKQDTTTTIKPTEKLEIAPKAQDSLKSILKEPVDISNTIVQSKEDENFNLEPKKSFNFVFKPKSPGKVKSPLKEHTENGKETDEEDETEEEENNTYFAPVIPLPEKIDVKTGEENEEVVYSHRAKLFRFIESEWKERGLGDVKILRHNETGKLRVVMRREQVLKICLNHVLTNEVIYKQKDDKSWQFVVNDFSEGTLELMQFCLRFKSSEIAEEFKIAVDKILANDKITTINLNVDTKLSVSSSDDNKLIEKLMLPPNFFTYRDNDVNCPGCRGCNSDEFVFPTVVESNLNTDDQNPLPFTLKYVPPALKSDSPEKQKNTNDISINNLGMNNNKPALSGGNIFGGQGFTFGSSNIFGNASSTTATTTTTNNNDSSVSATFTFGIRSKDSDAVSEEDNEKEEKYIFSSALGNSSNKTSGNILAPASLTSFSFTTAAKELPVTSVTKDDSSTAAINTFCFTPSSFIKKNEDTMATTGSKFDLISSSSIDNNVQTEISSLKSAEIKISEDIPKPQPSIELSADIFKTDPSLSFASLASSTAQNTAFNNIPKPQPSIELSADVFKTDPSLSFASLASSTAQNTAFNNANAPAAGFFGLSNNQDFSNFLSAKNNNTNDNQNNVAGGGEDAGYDPHYEPIIALPKEIVVSTGEEDEVKIFGERSKLFRFDSTTKEWKERGVGELKILHHPGQGTYRLLLRREQIHKLVLNHIITVDFVYNQMNSSGNAYCWATLNYSEEHPEGQVEKLAARFKNPDIAEHFNSEINKCLNQLKSRGDLEPEED